jgi:Thiamine pyrophosphate enzyme, C-terminal TPP binding domain
MGFAIPAAIAAKLFLPDRPVACVVGDGGLLSLLICPDTGSIITLWLQDKSFISYQFTSQWRGLCTHAKENS